jgi:bifunctional non-homologous end joining protein LigD
LQVTRSGGNAHSLRVDAAGAKRIRNDRSYEGIGRRKRPGLISQTSGSMWVHEIKHDGYRLMVRSTPAGVRIKSRNGYDWSDRFGWIVEGARKLSATSFVIDGEGVILNPDGNSNFDRLHSRGHDREIQLLGFDLLELDGTDLRRDPLMHRKATLASLLRRSRDGIQYVEHIEAMDGATVFEHACKLGLEGIVSKRRDKPYEHGRSRAWLKIKNPESPAAKRIEEGTF